MKMENEIMVKAEYHNQEEYHNDSKNYVNVCLLSMK
jgi:hypothetical protein